MEAGGFINFEEQEQADDQHFEQWTPAEEKRKAFAYVILMFKLSLSIK